LERALGKRNKTANLIGELRTRLDFAQDKFAAKLGVRSTTIHRW
jgi:DNA-binding transcriptional regulator YiaG